MASGSVFFSYERFLKENKAKQGELGVLIAMGPGLSIESALLMW
jgi:predicted naringenin-chalcone synthase